MQLAMMGSILLLGFLGSWHCGVMCGPLSCNFRAKDDFLSYHFGRLFSYLVMAAIVFYGIQFFKNVESRSVRLASGIVFGIVLILFGLNQLQLFQSKKIQFKFYKVQIRLLGRFQSLAKRFPIVLGLLTGLFPCGWLYTFLLLASQLPSLASASLVVFLFWLSSLPAFVVVTGFMAHLIRGAPTSYRKISAGIVILAGLFSIFGHWADILFLQ